MLPGPVPCEPAVGAERTEAVRTKLKWGLMLAPLDAAPHPTLLQSDTRPLPAAGKLDCRTPPGSAPAFRGPRMRPVALVQVQRGLASEPRLVVPKSKTCRRSRLSTHEVGSSIEVGERVVAYSLSWVTGLGTPEAEFSHMIAETLTSLGLRTLSLRRTAPELETA